MGQQTITTRFSSNQFTDAQWLLNYTGRGGAQSWDSLELVIHLYLLIRVENISTNGKQVERGVLIIMEA